MSQDLKSSPVKKHPGEDFPCKWAGCENADFPTLTQLVNHVTNMHLNLTAQALSTGPASPQNSQTQPPLAPSNVRYTCLWEGCSRFSIEQPSRFALISHCRTHTGEKPYFCPIPECEKHFTRSDALAKHVKGVHDLHQHRDAIALLKHRSESGKFSLPDIDVDTLSDDAYTELLDRDYELRVPWWFSKNFVNVLSDGGDTLASLYRQPFETRSYDVASQRYKALLKESENGAENEELISESDAEKSSQLAALQGETRDIVAEYRQSVSPDMTYLSDGSSQETYDALRAALSTAAKVNKIVKKKLHSAVAERRRLWVVNQALLDANIKLGLSSEVESAGLKIDAVDKVLLAEGIEEPIE